MVLEGKEAEQFVEKAKLAEQNKGSIDFSEEHQTMKNIIKKSEFTELPKDFIEDTLKTLNVLDVEKEHQKGKPLINALIDKALEERVPDKIYEAIYCSCRHESDAQTISVHKTRKGAEMAIEFHKNELSTDFNEWYDPEIVGWNYDKYISDMYWDIRETQLLD